MYFILTSLMNINENPFFVNVYMVPLYFGLEKHISINISSSPLQPWLVGILIIYRSIITV